MHIGKLHLLLVHFPIALLLAGVLGEALWAILRKGWFRSAARYCLVLGALGAIPTAITGSLRDDENPSTGERAALIDTHGNLGITTLCLGIAAAALSVWRRPMKSYWLVAYIVILAATVVFVSLTGHYGGMVAFGRDYLSNVFNRVP